MNTDRMGQQSTNEAQEHTQDIELISHADFPTRFGHFTLYGFLDHRNGKEHTAVVKGNVAQSVNCPVRVHSECHTGDIWGSLRCDCREQLESSLEYISQQDFGAVLYIKQEGRGIGLLNKIKAYQLQDQGLDTVDANLELGFPADAREYHAAAAMLRLLKIQSIALLTNNPDKIEQLQTEGITITGRIPIQPTPNKYNQKYLNTKREKMRHMY